jgi:hypothetical protein
MKIGLNVLEYYVSYYFYYYLVIYQTYSMILIFIYNSHFRQLKTLAFATANTNQIALGTRVIEMLFHGPVMLARRFATLDLLSQDKVFDYIIQSIAIGVISLKFTCVISRWCILFRF